MQVPPVLPPCFHFHASLSREPIRRLGVGKGDRERSRTPSSGFSVRRPASVSAMVALILTIDPVSRSIHAVPGELQADTPALAMQAQRATSCRARAEGYLLHGAPCQNFLSGATELECCRVSKGEKPRKGLQTRCSTAWRYFCDLSSPRPNRGMRDSERLSSPPVWVMMMR